MADDQIHIKLSDKHFRNPIRDDQRYIHNSITNLSNGDMYLNLTVHNNKETGQPIHAVYTEDRKRQLLTKGTDWKMTVVRFDCPSQEIPMFYFEDNKYSITLRNSIGDNYRVFLKYENWKTQTDAQKPIWDVWQMVKMINNAVDEAYEDYVNSGNADPDKIDPNYPITDKQLPRLIFNPSSLLFEWHFPVIDNAVGGADDAWGANVGWKLYTNLELDFLFENFPTKHNYNATDGKNVEIKVYDQYNNIVNIASPPAEEAGLFYIMKQTSQTLNLWYELYKIVVASNMEIRKEFIGIQSKTNPDSIGSLGILTDFDVSFPYPTAQRITYSPSAEFRWIDLPNNGPLKFIDYRIYYQTQSGELRELMLESGQACNLKLLFRRK